LLLALTGCCIIFASCKTQEQAADLPPKTPTNDLFRDYFHQAIGEKMIGHYDRAIEIFEECLKLEPNSSAVHFALSDLYELQGNKTKAIEFAKRAFELDKLNKWYTLRLADLYFGIGDYASSATYFDLAIDEEEQNLDLKFKYAEALIYSDQYQKAIDMMNVIEVETGKIPQLSLTKHDMYMALGQEEKAQAELNSLINEDPSNVENRVFVAEYFLNTNQAEKAKQVALDAIKIDPESGSAYVVLADVEIRSGNISAAFGHLKTAFAKDDVELERKLELISGLMPYAFSADPDAPIIQQGIGDLFAIIYDPALKNSRLHSIYGTFLQQQGKKTEALAQFRMVCELNKDDYQAWDNLLNIEYDLNAYRDMFNDAQKAIELFPSQPMLYLLAGIGAYESGNFNAAEEYLFLGKDLVVQNNELLAEFYYHLGKVSGIQKNYSEAYTYLDQAKKILPQFAKAYGAKARFLFEEGKISESQLEIKSGLAIEPNNASLLHVQGLIYLQQKDYPAALKTLERAAINGYTNGDILESYGDALYLNGDKEKAYQTWVEAEKNGNNSAVLKRKIADKTYYEN
jgi:tetratricopeptide (TPR) repeat protein